MGEKMKNAPVYFTIAQVRHNPVLRLGAYADEIQDRMRKVGYPDFKKGVAMAFSLMSQEGDEQQGQPPVIERIDRLMFFNSDNTQGFVVEKNAISFHTTEYDTFDTFVDEFMRGVGIVHECITLAHTERIGLRYLDAVVPPNGEKGLPDYLTSGVLGIHSVLPKEIQVTNSMSSTHFITSECAVLARTFIQAGPLGFPLDIQPIGVKIADRFQKINGVHAIVDTDASIEERHMMNLEALKSQLKTLRNGIEIAFKATVTSSALSAWKN